MAFNLYKMSKTREINWREFVTDFLNTGKVKSLEVINNNKVNVIVHPDFKNELPFMYYFTIGSVDAFERNLEQVQNEANINRNDRVPVAYRNEADM